MIDGVMLLSAGSELPLREWLFANCYQNRIPMSWSTSHTPNTKIRTFASPRIISSTSLGGQDCPRHEERLAHYRFNYIKFVIDGDTLSMLSFLKPVIDKFEAW